MTILFLARHGESDWNAERRWQGHADRSLTDRGRAQAAALAERLRAVELDAVYSSDLRRALETAHAVAETKDLEVQPLRALREVDVGSWSGLTRIEAERRFPADYERWLHGGPGWRDGESYQDMSRRVVGAALGIAREHEPGRVLLVSHGGPIRALHAAALGLDIHAYRRIRPVEPNARLSAVCAQNRRLTELCAATEIDDLLARDQRARVEASRQPPSPAG